VAYGRPGLANGQAGWSIDVIWAEPGKAEAIRMHRFNYPVS
jgi:hypothetical protein